MVSGGRARDQDLHLDTNNYWLSASTTPKTFMTMENQHFKIYFLVKIGNFQCHVSFQWCNLTGIGHFVSAREGTFLKSEILSTTFSDVYKVTFLHHLNVHSQTKTTTHFIFHD